ncbi:c-type cytochrome [Salipiger marinus]|jgi:cytochrome c|uniref:c-type cytochrome n=1 Tax=Salipiger marinus TaxID=555512 RepID=UPI000E9642E0|nr:c-type cytochrome [Salipiger manganoxidans]MCD1617311.1 c-type cytochrome [Salipiger manganoxidans]MEB3417365.1 c-type cytochrome [Salipiger manganoxidans]HBM61681.1 cytochrome C [Citreicella sp.]
MTARLAIALTTLTLATAAHAEGDVATGQKTFETRCRACHMIADPAGEVIQRGGRTGPNLFGVADQPAAADPDFRYKASLQAAAEQGLVWDEAAFVAYVQDPTAFLKEFTGDAGARSAMTFKLKDGGADVFAYLASLSPES